MTLRRLRLSLKRDEALSVTRVSIGKDRLVYILVTDKKLKCQNGKSRIAYIGTTKKGISRISQSVASRAETILKLHGVRSFHARVVTCKKRKNVRTWHKLERAMLITFKDLYGTVPMCNSLGSKMKKTDEFKYFAPAAVRTILEELA